MFNFRKTHGIEKIYDTNLEAKELSIKYMIFLRLRQNLIKKFLLIIVPNFEINSRCF